MTDEQELELESPLKKRREELDLTQSDVARAIGTSVQTVSNWETGRHKEEKLTLLQVKGLCRVMRWNIDELPDYLGPQHLNADLSVLTDLDN